MERQVSSSVDFQFNTRHSGVVDMVKFFDHVAEAKWLSYWSGETTVWLSDWCDDPMEPYSRACGYVFAWLYDQLDDAGWVVSRYDGVNQDLYSGEHELDHDTSFTTDDDPRWLELVAAHPWLDAPKPDESVDPGGTEPLF